MHVKSRSLNRRIVDESPRVLLPATRRRLNRSFRETHLFCIVEMKESESKSNQQIKTCRSLKTKVLAPFKRRSRRVSVLADVLQRLSCITGRLHTMRAGGALSPFSQLFCGRG